MEQTAKKEEIPPRKLGSTQVAKVEKVFKIGPKKKRSPIRRKSAVSARSASQMFDEINENRLIGSSSKSKDIGIETGKSDSHELTKMSTLSNSVSKENVDPVRAETPQEYPKFDPKNILKVYYE